MTETVSAVDAAFTWSPSPVDTYSVPDVTAARTVGTGVLIVDTRSMTTMTVIVAPRRREHGVPAPTIQRKGSCAGDTAFPWMFTAARISGSSVPCAPRPNTEDTVSAVSGRNEGGCRYTKKKTTSFWMDGWFHPSMIYYQFLCSVAGGRWSRSQPIYEP